MGSAINLTPFAVGELMGKDAEGVPLYVAIVKASFTWKEDGSTEPVTPVPIQEEDEFAGEPDTAGLVRATDLLPPKPRVDVVLQGSLAFPSPVAEVDVAMRVGARLRKALRAHGTRFWLPGVVHDMIPSKAQPVAGLPIAWELSFGGADARDPRGTEQRNPAGSGATKRPAELQGKRAPSFEAIDTPIKSSSDRPAPCGFGAIASHWQPRASLCGTFDEAWQASRSPLLPKDFFSGEERYFEDLLLATSRLAEDKATAATEVPAFSVGETGAAAGFLAIATLAFLHSKGVHGRPSLAVLSCDGPERGAVLLGPAKRA